MMINEMLFRAERGEPLWLPDLRGSFANCVGARKAVVRLTGSESSARDYELFFPPADGEREKAFLLRIKVCIHREEFVVRGGGGMVAAGAVDEDIAGTERVQDRLMRSFHARSVGDVGSDGDGFAARRSDLIRNSLDLGERAAKHRYFCPALGQRLAELTAQDARAAGDYGNFTGKIGLVWKIHLYHPFLICSPYGGTGSSN